MSFKSWATRNVLINVFTICEDANVTQKDSEKYWFDDRFHDWLKKNGVNYPKKIPPFADGGQGRAYFILDKVVKFTKNRVEANVAKAAMGQDTPTAIIDVWRIPDGVPLWAILQKYVNVNIEKELKDAADIASVIMDDLKDEDPNFTHFPDEPAKQRTIATDALKKYKKPISLLPYVISAMNAINQLFYKTGFTHDDAGPTNIAKDQSGRIVFHDLGPNVNKSFNARSALDRIHQNREKLGLPNLIEV